MDRRWQRDERPPVHYGCHEFRDDCEQVITNRAHRKLAELYHAHLAFCGDCQRFHHRLESVYRRPPRIPRVEGFAKEREFQDILGRVRAQETARAEPLGKPIERFLGSVGVGGSLSVGALTAAAAILIASLLIPSFGGRLFGEPDPAQVELGDGHTRDDFRDDVHIPDRRSLGHQAQAFGRVVGGDGALFDDQDRPIAGDSLTVGTRIETGEHALQVAMVGRMVANFEPDTIASWHTATPALVELGLVSGTLAIRYDRRPEDPVLQVRTPSAIVRVVGTVFTVTVDARGTSVSVLRGRVEVVDPTGGRWLGEVEAGHHFDVTDSTYRDVGRRQVAAALPLTEQTELVVTVGDDGELTFEEPEPTAQVPLEWTVPGLSNDPDQRTVDRIFDPDSRSVALDSSARRRTARRDRRRPEPTIDTSLLAELDDAEAERRAKIAGELELCRTYYDDSKTRFRAARCLSDFMKRRHKEPEAVEGLLLLGTLRMDFAHDYQSATRNIEEFLRRAPEHPKAELARYKLVLAAIDAGYIDKAIGQARAYLHDYPDGQYVGRILQRFPELKSEL